MFIIIGASSGVGKAIAEEFAKQGKDLLLVSREQRDTAAVASDLKLRHNVNVEVVQLDLADGGVDFTPITSAVIRAGPRFYGVLFPVGTVTESDCVGMTSSQIEQIFFSNCLSIVKLINRIHAAVNDTANFSLVGFGSIAAARGRGSNMVYSAAKKALQFYFEGLRHACVDKNIFVQFYLLGYMDTNLAFAYNVPLPKGSPEKLARRVYRNINKDIGLRYFPSYWLVIVNLIRVIPWAIFKKMKF